jgi:hypothetical protein
MIGQRRFAMDISNVCFSDTYERLIQKRLKELETEFGSGPESGEQSKKEQDLLTKLSCLLGKEHAFLLREYADLIALRNDTDAEWFYRKGFDDSLEIATDYAIYS